MKRSHARGTLFKVFLLVACIGMLAAFWSWKANNGIIGTIRNLDFNSADTILFLRQGQDGQTNLYTVKADGSDERQLTNDKVAKHEPAWGPDGKAICYCGEVKDESAIAYQIFLLGQDGSRQATHGTGSKQMPLWKPDGKQIAYIVGGAIKVMDKNGLGTEQLYPPPHKGNTHTENGEINTEGLKQPPVIRFQWAPDGSAIAGIIVTEGDDAVTQGQSNWWQKPSANAPEENQSTVADPETLIILPAGDLPSDFHPERSDTNASQLGFSWYPDAKQIAVSVTARKKVHGIFVIRADEPKMEAQTLFGSTGYTVAPMHPVVSPDGSQIAFEAWRMDSAENRELLGIAVLSTDPAKGVRVTTAADLPKLPIAIKAKATSPQWSPDGSRLLYMMTNANGTRDLWVAKADGSNPVNLTKGKGDNFDACWSPLKK